MYSGAQRQPFSPSGVNGAVVQSPRSLADANREREMYSGVQRQPFSPGLSSMALEQSESSQVGSGTPNPNLKLYQYVLDLTVREQRESVLLALSKQREEFPDLAPILWHSVGTVAALLQEIVSIYPLLQSVYTLTPKASNRCCNALALLQCVASHPETRAHFLSAHIPLFLYPFLNTTHTKRPFEYLRLTSLGVIGALVKMDDPDVISFLLQTEIIPLCLRIMNTGSELLRTVATFIVQKILLDDNGLSYICATPDRFYAVSDVLRLMIDGLEKQPSARLMKHIVHCYLRLAANLKAREALQECLPAQLRDNTFSTVLKDEATTKRHLAQLLRALNGTEYE